MPGAPNGCVGLRHLENQIEDGEGWVEHMGSCVWRCCMSVVGMTSDWHGLRVQPIDATHWLNRSAGVS
ncbi:hypothetical protein DLS60_13630 [Staphylococcus pseudintermedius]|nr:hypothetical protein DLS60_13630 [Staphylococcus pseudintermedius]